MNRKRMGKYIVLSLLTTLVTAIPNSGSASVTGPTVTIANPLSFTSLNPDVRDMGTSSNLEISFLQRTGFFYYDNTSKLVENNTLGSFRILSERPFRVQYTINPGRVWSDGTPITAVDLLIHHVICSTKYSVAASLGNPLSSQSSSAFNSGCYGSEYDNRSVGLPQLSADKMSLTFEFDSFFVNWRQSSPELFPTHALVLMSDGITELKSESFASAAKARFEKAFYSYDTTTMLNLGKIWSNNYNINSIDSRTNPLLLISNGGYQIESAVPNQSVNLVYNERYNSGPAVQGIAKIVYRILPDGGQALGSLQRKEIDIYQSIPTADAIAQFKGVAGYSVIGFDLPIYEHLDLRSEKSSGSTDLYNGVFKGDSQRAKDLRRAFLLTIPRDDIVNNLIKPINSNASRLDSLLYFPLESGYQANISQSGVGSFSQGSQSARQDEALALVKKHFPAASPSNLAVKVNLLWGTAANARRLGVVQLIKQSAARAGFEVNAPGVQSWSSQLTNSSWDAAIFAWVRAEGDVDKNSEMYCSTCSNNFWGWSNPTIDSSYKAISNENLTAANLAGQYLKLEQAIYSDSLSLPLYQHPGAYVVSNELSRVIPSNNSIGIVWNYWQWSKNGSKEFPQFVANLSSSSSNNSGSSGNTTVVTPAVHQNAWTNLNWSTEVLGTKGYVEQKFTPLALGKVATNPPRWVGWNNLDFCWEKLPTYGTGKSCGRIGWGFWSQSGDVLTGNFDFALYDGVDFVKMSSTPGSTCDRLGPSANLSSANNITCWVGVRIIPNHTYALKLMADTQYGDNWWQASLINETTGDVYILGRIKSLINDNSKKLASLITSFGYSGEPKSCDDVPIIDTYMTNAFINGKQTAYAGYETGNCVKSTVSPNELSQGGFALRMGGQKPETRELIARNIQISPSDAKLGTSKPTTPSFSGVNFVGNKINIAVNIGSAAAARPEKIYLVAPKLGVSGSNPLAGKISGSTATWSIDFDKVLSGAMIPLEIVGERNGVKSDSLVGSYQAPVLSSPITKVPAAPTNFKQRVIGNSILVTADAKLSANSLAREAQLFGKSLGISKKNAITGEVVGSRVILEIPIKASMLGKKFPVTIYLSNEKGESKPLSATLSVPAAPKPIGPTVIPKPSVSTETVLCFRASQSRAFAGAKCPPGWEEK